MESSVSVFNDKAKLTGTVTLTDLYDFLLYIRFRSTSVGLSLKSYIDHILTLDLTTFIRVI